MRLSSSRTCSGKSEESTAGVFGSVQREERTGMWPEIISNCFAFMLLVMLGCFAAGSCEIASERAERKRIEREIREKYGRTY